MSNEPNTNDQIAIENRIKALWEQGLDEADIADILGVDRGFAIEVIAEYREGFDRDEELDNFRDDVEADADVLRMAGMGTDEDYGFFGGYGDE